MSDETKQLIEKAAASLKAVGAREVYLFGSAATGTMTEDSDVDMAVTGLPPERFFHAMGQASTILGRPLDLVDLDELNLFAEYLMKKGKLQRVA